MHGKTTTLDDSAIGTQLRSTDWLLPITLQDDLARSGSDRRDGRSNIQ